jgi:hypothetical protein
MVNGYSRDGRTPRETSGTASESVELPVLFGRANEKEEVWDFLPLISGSSDEESD